MARAAWFGEARALSPCLTIRERVRVSGQERVLSLAADPPAVRIFTCADASSISDGLRPSPTVPAVEKPSIIRAIESRVHDKKAPLKVEKAIGDPYDDVWDALRYALYSHHDPEKKPLEMRVQDRLNVILKGDEQRGIASNPSMAAFQYQKITREEQKQEEDEPSYYGGGVRRRIREMRRRGRL